VGYDTANRRTSLTLPNGIVVESAYDDDSQLTGLTYKLSGVTIGGLTYGYDAGGRRVSMGGSYARTNLPAALNSATYDDANQIATWAGTSFTYDDNGNLTSDGSKTYSWNARNELTGLSGGVSAGFAYDAVGRRRSRTVGSTMTQFLYDGLNPVQELASGTPTANLLTGLGIDEYFTRTDAAGARNLLTDARGSTIALTDGSGSVQTEYTYDPFGSVTTSGSTNGNTFGFTGRENDGTGLNFYRARYYAPVTQRFVSQDPLGLADGPNTFVYAGNEPIANIDPLGLEIVVVSRAPILPRALAPNMRFNPARPIPRPTRPPIPQSIPVDPRIPPIGPVKDPLIELLADILDKLTGWPAATRPPASRKDPDCRVQSGIPVCQG
jgi:RHS repeat-associated protein